MSCPGLHCPGCSGGQTAGIIGAAAVGLVLAAETVQWVADRVWWIGSTAAACFALAVAASMWLEARSDRRAAAWGAARGIYSRADLILPYRTREPLTDPGRPAITTPGITLNIFGVPSHEQAAIIRQALPGHAATRDAEE